MVDKEPGPELRLLTRPMIFHIIKTICTGIILGLSLLCRSGPALPPRAVLSGLIRYSDSMSPLSAMPPFFRRVRGGVKCVLRSAFSRWTLLIRSKSIRTTILKSMRLLGWSALLLLCLFCSGPNNGQYSLDITQDLGYLLRYLWWWWGCGLCRLYQLCHCFASTSLRWTPGLGTLTRRI